jgi:hypothetical protein
MECLYELEDHLDKASHIVHNFSIKRIGEFSQRRLAIDVIIKNDNDKKTLLKIYDKAKELAMLATHEVSHSGIKRFPEAHVKIRNIENHCLLHYPDIILRDNTYVC